MNKILRSVIGFLLLILILTIGFYYFWPGRLLESVIAFNRWKNGIQTRSIEVDNHIWPYFEGNTDFSETIVFVHGFGSKKEYWLGMMGLFVDNYRVVTPDLPGFGRNTIIEAEDYGIPSQVDRLAAFLSAINSDKVHLVGCSMGGWISGYFAIKYPQRVLSLTLMDSAGILSAEPSYSRKHYEKTGENLLIPEDVAGFSKMMKVVYFEPPYVPDKFAEYFIQERKLRLSSEKRLFKDLRASEAFNLESRLHQIQARTLIIWGEDDRIIDVSTARILEKGIEKSKTVIFPKVGHAPYLETPEKTAQVIQDFIRSF